MQKICVRILSGMYAQDQLSLSDTILAPVFLTSFSEDLRRAYIDGTAEGFRTFRLSAVEKDWRSWCESLQGKEYKDFCKSFFPLVGEDVGA